MSASSRYEVLARIATGGMASVFVGRLKTPLEISRLVALKRPHPFILADPKLRRSVLEEARAASAIHHSNVVAVVDIELVEGEPLLVLEYIEGTTLADLMRYAAATGISFAPVAMRIVLDTARGLDAAHTQRGPGGQPLGILHRDVTPHNVLVGIDGVARLSDFGIAKMATGGGEKTSTGAIKGKLGYLAPEYLAFQVFDVRSDLFSLAIVAWESLAGRRLFGGGNDVETMAKILSLARPPLAEIAPALDAFEPVLARALARDPAERQRTVAELASELEAAAGASIGIASPAEVAAFVERASGEELRARRAALAAAIPRPAEEMDQLPLRAPTERDALATQSFDVNALAPAAFARPTGEDATAATPELRPRGRRRAAWAAGLAAGAALLVGSALVLGRAGSTQGDRAVAASAATSATATTAADVQGDAGPTAPEVPREPPPPEATALSASPASTKTRGRAPKGPSAVAKPRASGSAPGFPSHAPPNPYAP